MAKQKNTIPIISDQDASSSFATNWIPCSEYDGIFFGISWTGSTLSGTLYIDLGVGNFVSSYGTSITYNNVIYDYTGDPITVSGTGQEVVDLTITTAPFFRLRYVAGDDPGTGTMTALAYGKSRG